MAFGRDGNKMKSECDLYVRNQESRISTPIALPLVHTGIQAFVPTM